MPFNPDEKTDALEACVYPLEDLDLSPYGLPGMVFNGELQIEIDHSSGDDEWYIDCATASKPDGTYHTYGYDKPAEILDGLVFRVIEKAVWSDRHLCDLIRDACKEHAQ